MKFDFNSNPEKKSPKIDDRKLHGNNDTSNLFQNKQIIESKHDDDSGQKNPTKNKDKDEDEATYYACLNKFSEKPKEKENKETEITQRYLATSYHL